MRFLIKSKPALKRWIKKADVPNLFVKQLCVYVMLLHLCGLMKFIWQTILPITEVVLYSQLLLGLFGKLLKINWPTYF
jgi:hypothetical protein